MKKILIALIAICAVLSCSKESVDNETPRGIKETISATILNTLEDETKTNYTIEGSEAIFCWKGTEKIGRIIYDGDRTTSHSIYTSTTSAISGETTLTFEGNTDANQTIYAVYPSKDETNGAKLDWYSSSTSIYLWLGESLTYDEAFPLKNIVPMVGKLDEGEFVFKPISGVLCVRIGHIPPSANKVTITSNNHYLSKLGFRRSSSNIGYLDEWNAIYKDGLLLGQNNSIDGKSMSKTYTFSTGRDFDKTYEFYFPIPAGVLNDETANDQLTITVSNGSTPLYTKTTSKEITISNGTITRLPIITLPSNSVSVSVGGMSTDIKAKVTDKSDLVSYIKVYAATTADAASAGVASAGTTIESLNTLMSVAGAYSSSGLYYIAYQGYDTNDNPLNGTSGTLTAYFLSSTDEIRFCSGQITGGKAHYYTNNSTRREDEASSITMTFEVSDDVSQGNIKLTEFDGFTCNDLSENEITVLKDRLSTRISNESAVSSYATQWTSGEYSAGSPMYGKYIPTETDECNLVFPSLDASPLFKLGNYKYRLVSSAQQSSGYNNSIFKLRLNYNPSSVGYYLTGTEYIDIRIVSNCGLNYLDELKAVPYTE